MLGTVFPQQYYITVGCLKVPTSALFSVNTALTLKGARTSKTLLSPASSALPQCPAAAAHTEPSGSGCPSRQGCPGWQELRLVLGAIWFQLPGVRGYSCGESSQLGRSQHRALLSFDSSLSLQGRGAKAEGAAPLRGRLGAAARDGGAAVAAGEPAPLSRLRARLPPAQRSGRAGLAFCRGKCCSVA